MLFTKRLREGVRRGDITCSVRIWTSPHVSAGRRYRMDEGEIEVDSVIPITLADLTPELARASGFRGVVDLLKVARHGRGTNVYLVRFHYLPPPVTQDDKKGHMAERKTIRVTGLLLDGHKALAVAVAFDPERELGLREIVLAPGRRGYPVEVLLGRLRFRSAIVSQNRQRFVLIDDTLARRAGAVIGSPVELTLWADHTTVAAAGAAEQASALGSSKKSRSRGAQ